MGRKQRENNQAHNKQHNSRDQTEQEHLHTRAHSDAYCMQRSPYQIQTGLKNGSLRLLDEALHPALRVSSIARRSRKHNVVLVAVRHSVVVVPNDADAQHEPHRHYPLAMRSSFSTISRLGIIVARSCGLGKLHIRTQRWNDITLFHLGHLTGLGHSAMVKPDVSGTTLDTAIQQKERAREGRGEGGYLKQCSSHSLRDYRAAFSAHPQSQSRAPQATSAAATRRPAPAPLAKQQQHTPPTAAPKHTKFRAHFLS